MDAPECPAEGWTIGQALEIFADPQLTAEAIERDRAWRAAGSPKRFVRAPGLGASLGDAARSASDRNLSKRRNLAHRRRIAHFKGLFVTGELKARGRRGSPTARREEIPATAWHHLRIADSKLSVVIEAGPEQAKIYDVRVRPVRSQASRKPDDELPRITLHKKAFLECRDWLVEIMEASPEVPTMTNAELWSIAKGRWPDLSENLFRKARKDAIQLSGSSWGEPGRPRKPKSKTSN